MLIYLMVGVAGDGGKITSPTASIKLAPNLHRIGLPIKIVDLIFPFGIYIENT